MKLFWVHEYIYINGSQKWDTVIKPKRLWFHSKKKIENLTKSTKLLFVAKTKIYKRRKCNVKRNEEAHRELGKGGGMSNGGGRVRVGGKGISSEEGERLNSLESCCCVGIVIVSVELRARLLIWRVWIVRHWSVLEREIEIERDKRKRVIDMLECLEGKDENESESESLCLCLCLFGCFRERGRVQVWKGVKEKSNKD